MIKVKGVLYNIIMRLKVKKLIEKHIKLIESGNIYQVFVNANYNAFNDDDMDELIDILENDLYISTLEIRKRLFGEVFKESLSLFKSGQVELANHLNNLFYNILGLSTDEIVTIINDSELAYVDHNYMMEIL